MKKYVSILLAAILCIAVSGCSNGTSSTEKQASEKQASENSTLSESRDEASDKSKPEASENTDVSDKNSIQIFDRSEKRIGQIPVNGGTTLTDSGIFYNTLVSAQTDDDAIVTGNNEGAKDKYFYHLYDPVTNKSYSFGGIEDQDYEAGYVRTELGGRLYTLVTTGNAMDSIPDPLLLVEFDLKEHTISKYTISENGFPYTAMAEVNGKLLILNHDQTDKLNDRLYSFDPESKQTEQVMQFELNGNTGDTIRSMYSNGKNIYILRLHFEGENNVTMFLDTYDLDLKKLSESDISSMLKESAGKDLAADDTINEMKQMVSKFMVLEEKYVYYENFSTTRFLGNVEDGRLFSETDGEGDMFLASSGSGKTFFYTILGGSKNENSIYEWENGSLQKSVFKADDERYYVTNASRSPDGKTIVQVAYVNPDDRNDTLPTKIYYF